MTGLQNRLGACIVAAVVLFAATPAAEAQIAKKKNLGFSPCMIRPDPPRSPLGVSMPGSACGVRPAIPSFSSPNSFLGTRVLSFGSSFNGSAVGRTFFNPRPAVYAPTFNNFYTDSTPWNYPSNNLGHCNAGSFYNYRSLSISAGPAYTPVPINVVLPTSLPPPPPILNPGWTVSGTRLPGPDRAVSEAIEEFRRGQFDNTPAPPPSVARKLSDSEAKEIEGILDRGDDLFAKRDYKRAREEYARALVIAGEDPGVRIPFGMSEFALGRFADAARAMRQAASVQPSFDPDSIDVRQAYDIPGEFDCHLRSLEHYVAAHPFDADGLFLLGFIKSCSGNPIGAKAVFEKYLALRDADPAVRPFIELVGGSN